MSKRRLSGNWLLPLAIFVWLVHGGAQAREPMRDTGRRLTEAALIAQGRCYRLIHHDTDAYADCLHALLRQEKKAGPRRLGIEYFGWVGALNSARLGMRGSEALAYEFLASFRTTQRKLQIDDLTLCRSIPGDCETRIARMRLMEKASVPQMTITPADARVSRSLPKLRVRTQTPTAATSG